MKELIYSIPKAELHIHIEGSLEPELMFEIGARNNIKLPFKDVNEVRKAYEFSNLQSFLDIYYQGANVLIKEKDFYDMTMAYLVKADEQNIRHTEIFFDPETHTDRGISFDIVINGIHGALEDAEKQMGLSSNLILCFLRHIKPETGSAMETLKKALPYKDWIVGVGLDSSEMGNPPKNFVEVFDEARKQGFRSVAHAGEEGPPEYIWQAINNLKSERIDHGVRSIEDQQLIKYLVDNQIPLTVCPLSNTKLRVFDTMEDHNIKRLMDMGVLVTVNSDDPAYFGGYIAENYIAIQEALGLKAEDIKHLAKNSFIASFISEDAKKKYIEEIDRLF